MTRKMLVQSIANTIATYRAGELLPPDAAHVDRWASQFTPSNQLEFLREFDHVIKQTFVTKAQVRSFVEGLATNAKLTGGNPPAYWSGSTVLNLQKVGFSQKSMVELLDEVLLRQFGFKTNHAPQVGGDFVYLDDIIFTGTRIGNDVEDWILNAAPQAAKLQIVVAGWHTFGQYKLSQKLKEAKAKSGKAIDITYWSIELFRFENTIHRLGDAQVLAPAIIPDSQVVHDYLAEPSKWPLKLRPVGGNLGIFSSEAARTLLESEFLIAGAIIRKKGTVTPIIRPLGFGYFGVGFGGLVVTYRNCPNNCPLAMWWGDPTQRTGPLAWYPLLSRDGNSSAKNVFSKFFPAI